MKKPVADPNAPICKITMQYRSGRGRVYEIESAGMTLDVHVSAPDRAEGAAEWLVAVHSTRSADAVVITETAATGVEALQKVGRAWIEKAPELGLLTFDWKAVAEALVSVRAI